MMIIQDNDEQRLKGEEESIMIGDENSTGKDDDISDFSLSNYQFSKSVNKRKQVKPNRLPTDDDGITKQDQPTDLTNGDEQISPNPSRQQQQQQEAYCNLCERSFCNKYFLKTHLAKKHGELNLISPLSSNETTDPSIPTSLSLPSCANNDQPMPLINNHQSSSISIKSSEDYCEICQKHFCNKYYLRKHKGECHGVYTDYIKSLQKSTNENPIKTNSNRSVPPSLQAPANTLLLNPFYPGPSDIKSLFPIPSSSNMPIKSSLSSSPKTSPQRTIRRCQICQQDFRNKSLFRMHMNTFHPNDQTKKSSLTPSPILPATNLGFLPPFVDTSSQLAQKIVTGQAPQTSYGIVNDSYFCAKMADRVVCEICNKQVCNKYFLKTHKAKVHGITTNENQEQINENLDHSNTYCSLCKKDFSTKYFYLFHMQTIHNDTSDPTYQTLIQLMKTAAAMNENANPFLSLSQSEQCDDESDGNTTNLSRKRSLSQSSTDNHHHQQQQQSPNKRIHSLPDANAGLQPFLLESEDPKFSHTFVPCMVYLPVIRRVTQQVKINLRLKPVLADASS